MERLLYFIVEIHSLQKLSEANVKTMDSISERKCFKCHKYHNNLNVSISVQTFLKFICFNDIHVCNALTKSMRFCRNYLNEINYGIFSPYRKENKFIL